NPGTTVTYDVVSTAALNTLEIQPTATLTFRTDINTQVVATNYLVLQGGSLIVGTQANPIAANVTASIQIPDVAVNTAVDPEQYGTSLIVMGQISMYGTAKS